MSWKQVALAERSKLLTCKTYQSVIHVSVRVADSVLAFFNVAVDGQLMALWVRSHGSAYNKIADTKRRLTVGIIGKVPDKSQNSILTYARVVPRSNGISSVP